MPHDAPTIETVAARAHVSRQTVSNVLNAPEKVLPETRERVLAAIRETGYRPHVAARELRTGRSQVIALRLPPLTDGINGLVLDRFLHAVTEAAETHDHRVMLFTARDDADEIAHYETVLRTARPDAFLLASTHRGDRRTRWLAEHSVPFATFGRPWDSDSPTHPWVDVDGRAGTRLAVEHLLALGHERIAYLGWPRGSDVGEDRRAGWLEAMTQGAPQVALDPLHLEVEDGVREGVQAAARLLDSASPTGLVCASDSLALGAAETVRRRGATVSVVGFDDTPVAAATGLTSVAQPLAEAARRAVELVLTRLAGDESPEPHVLLRPELVVRESTSKARP